MHQNQYIYDGTFDLQVPVSDNLVLDCMVWAAGSVFDVYWNCIMLLSNIYYHSAGQSVQEAAKEKNRWLKHEILIWNLSKNVSSRIYTTHIILIGVI